MTGARVAVKILELAFQKALWSVEASPAAGKGVGVRQRELGSDRVSRKGVGKGVGGKGVGVRPKGVGVRPSFQSDRLGSFGKDC